MQSSLPGRKYYVLGKKIKSMGIKITGWARVGNFSTLKKVTLQLRHQKKKRKEKGPKLRECSKCKNLEVGKNLVCRGDEKCGYN